MSAWRRALEFGRGLLCARKVEESSVAEGFNFSFSLGFWIRKKKGKFILMNMYMCVFYIFRKL